MKYIPGQDYRIKIETLRRLIANGPAGTEARYTSPELTDEERERVESVTRFEQRRGLVIKQNWRRSRMTGL